MQKFCLALDLKDDAQLIAEYEAYHRSVWPEVQKSITDAGILSMEIYRVYNRLFMIIEANDEFSFQQKAAADAGNTAVSQWETLMWRFQQPLAQSGAGEKWVLMEKIFQLNHQ